MSSFLRGYLDSGGHPALSIRVFRNRAGASTDVEAHVEAMIDTGFSGFLMLPLNASNGLGLRARGTSDFTLADGSFVSYSLARGSVAVVQPRVGGSREMSAIGDAELMIVEGLIVLGGDEALLGMDFIRRLEKWLVVGPSGLLVDDDALSIRGA